MLRRCVRPRRSESEPLAPRRTEHEPAEAAELLEDRVQGAQAPPRALSDPDRRHLRAVMGPGRAGWS
ncbi:hypothetical protein NDU88_005765 [Pleurodeles waltl]|uniref:Uncharacterized protein n=1 Tax=Pleurodeles waltl TaxID=8319 RepID=A0AAV7MZ04_PLEWA|nr:hypothetical protein NDU88_005765 [Pleurodeles waltl]